MRHLAVEWAGIRCRVHNRVAASLALALVALSGAIACGPRHDPAAMGMPWARVDDPVRDRAPETRRIEALLALRPGMSVADVGAGVGYFTFRFARAVGPEGRVVATDVDPVMLERMRATRAARGAHDVEVLAVDRDTLGLAPASVDRIVMVNSISLAECDGGGASTLSACHRALRPGGRLLIVRERVHTTEWQPPYGNRPGCDEPSGSRVIEMARGLFRVFASETIELGGAPPPGESAGYLLALDRI